MWGFGFENVGQHEKLREHIDLTVIKRPRGFGYIIL